MYFSHVDIVVKILFIFCYFPTSSILLNRHPYFSPPSQESLIFQNFSIAPPSLPPRKLVEELLSAPLPPLPPQLSPLKFDTQIFHFSQFIARFLFISTTTSYRGNQFSHNNASLFCNVRFRPSLASGIFLFGNFRLSRIRNLVPATLYSYVHFFL